MSAGFAAFVFGLACGWALTEHLGALRAYRLVSASAGMPMPLPKAAWRKLRSTQLWVLYWGIVYAGARYFG